MQGSVLGFLKCAFTPEESQVSQGVSEFLRRYRGVGKHACAGMSFPDCMRALLVSLQG